MNKNNIITEMPIEHYHNHPAVSKSQLDQINKHPLLLRNMIHETDAMKFGSAFHCAILEKKLFDQTYMLAPDIDRRTKAGKREWIDFSAQNADKTLLKVDIYNQILAMRESLLSNSDGLLKHGTAELSLFWQNCDIDIDTECRCRPDWLDDDIAIDIKTTIDASPAGFAKSCANYRYHVQAAFYSDGINATLGFIPSRFIFLAIEKNPPYLLGIYELETAAIEMGRRQYINNIATYNDYLDNESNRPCYNAGRITTIDLPRWAYTDKNITDKNIGDNYVW